MGTVFKAISSLDRRRITTLKFKKTLCKVLGIGKSSTYGQNQSGVIGLAISGGVDSMALAVLCSKIQKVVHAAGDNLSEDEEWQHLKNISFKAFIVDHQVRSGSSEEAQSVSNVLEKRGIEAEILKIELPKPLSTEDDSNFESLARKYRFQLLGKACRDNGIKSLLLAHHEDDQVETMFMRLTGGHKKAGLLGIKEAGGIPECYGIHGVYESGGLDALSPTTLITQASSSPETPSRRELQPEQGGIRIYRPMLQFPKSRLIATCRHENMEWFEDHTNKDPTLTIRNAVRHMYNNYVMPAALSKTSLISLRQRVKDQADALAAAVESVLAKCSIEDFSTRTGTVKVLFPTTSDLLTASEVSKIDAGILASRLLSRIISLVTPLESVRPQYLRGAPARIFPVLPGNSNKGVSGQHMIAGVIFQPQRAQEWGWKMTPAMCFVWTEAPTQWLLSRQPYKKSHIKQKAFTFSSTKDQTWTDWTLWDGRYWIRIQHLNPDPDTSVIVRPFQTYDRMDFRGSLDAKAKKVLNYVLKTEAPEHIRWTLPAIVSCSRSSKEERVLVLPTIGIQRPGVDSILRWEVRYKKIYTEGLPMPEAIAEEEGRVSSSQEPEDIPREEGQISSSGGPDSNDTPKERNPPEAIKELWLKGQKTRLLAALQKIQSK